MKTALVTGHLGFAGRHYRAELKAHGWDVHGIDLKSPIPSDVRRYFLGPYSNHYDLVIHCAAVVGGRETIDGAPLALASNLELDAGLFQWGLRTRPGRIVYVSSSAAYPVWMQKSDEPGDLPVKLKEHYIDETLATSNDLGSPDQLYGWAKLTGENLAWRARAEGLAVTVIRPFSGYGEDQDDTYPFRAFIERAKRREDPFHVWGNGQQVRDFIHIDDIVDATLLMAREGIDGPVNLGTGRAVSMLELARMVSAAAGYSPEVVPLSDKPSGVQYRVADTTYLSTFYTPKIDLEQGIARALKENS